MMGLPDGEKTFENMFTRFDTIHERDGQTDRYRTTAQAAIAAWLGYIVARQKNIALVRCRLSLYTSHVTLHCRRL